MGDSNNNQKTKVRLELHAQQLKNVAGTFKGVSDPFAIVTLLANDPNQKPKVLGKTEVIKNNLSPRWTTKFDLDYDLTTNTRINVGVWDEVRKGSNIPMGSALFEVGEVLGARGNTKAKKLRIGGTLFARITPAPLEELGLVHLHLRGIKLKNLSGVLGKSDPFLEVSAKVESAGGLTWQPIYRSKPVMNDLNPDWPAFSLDVARLCGGDLDREILIEIWDYDKKGNHHTMGKFETSVNGLMESVVAINGSGDAKSIDTSKAFSAKVKGKEYGHVVVATAKLSNYKKPTGGEASGPGVVASSPPKKVSSGGAATAVAATIAMQNLGLGSIPTPLAPPSRPKFVDYVTGGCELELSIAIDFTGSNGDPRKPGTLHYRHPDGQLNDYEKAITAVGAIIARYDSDQKFPVFGFGAKYSGIIQHCFQIGGKPELDGISGVLEGYRNVFRTGLTMSGPTVFAEVIDYAAATGRSKQQEYQRIGKQAYKILLILTDGAVTDVERTKRSIQAASDAPLSIVIVGIGNADFAAMQDLDDFMHNSPSRDIVQFVEFSRHAHDRSSLTKATLEEIPDQLVEYFHSRSIMPLPPISGSQLSLHPEEATEEDIDLSVEVSPEGEISLADYDGAVYDDTKYGTISDYSNVKPLPVPTTSTPGAPFVPGRPYAPPVTAAVAAPPPQPSVFHVQVPPGIAPGMQLQIQHPTTQQPMIVTVPPGVPPGGQFAVQY